MHSRLGVSVLHNCVLYLDDCDLLSTALTSRHLKPIALRVLWQQLPDLSAVIRCLPRDAWKCESGEFAPIRDLSQQDWSSILPYLPMVRSIRSLYGTEISDQFFEQILNTFPGSVLFPNLCDFALQGYCSDVALEFTQNLLGPKMVTLTVYLGKHNSQHSRASLLQAIPLLCPQLKKLNLNHSSPSFPEVSEAICRCQHLEELVVPSLSETALIHVSHLPKLRVLMLGRHHTSKIAHFPSVSTTAFPALSELYIINISHPSLLSIIAAISSPDYKSCNIGFDKTPKAGEWSTLFNQLGTMPHGPRWEELKFFDVGFEEHSGAGSPDLLITDDVFYPILALKNITTIDMEAFPVFDVDDWFLLELARTCQTLKVLNLGTGYCTGRRSGATLRSYIHFIQYCPDITTIGLVVDASKTGSWARRNKAVRKFDNSAHRLNICVGDSYIENPETVARFLSTIIGLSFQCLLELKIAENCPFDIERKWEIVERRLSFDVLTSICSGGDGEGEVECGDAADWLDEESEDEAEWYARRRIGCFYDSY